MHQVIDIILPALESCLLINFVIAVYQGQGCLQLALITSGKEYSSNVLGEFWEHLSMVSTGSSNRVPLVSKADFVQSTSSLSPTPLGKQEVQECKAEKALKVAVLMIHHRQ